MKNKKGQLALVSAIILALIILLILAGGGAITLFKVGQFLSKVPVWIWVLLAIIFIFKNKGGKRK